MMAFDDKACANYTDLNNDEREFLRDYSEKLQQIADSEEADVFIDCISKTGRNAIVVAEAKPITVPSAYKSRILGMIIRWEDEPAVERSFRLGIPTTGMAAVSSPENQKVVQFVYPLRFRDKVIATLIYEKARWYVEEFTRDPSKEDCSGKRELDSASGQVLDYLEEAVLFTDAAGIIIQANDAAKSIFANLGYVESLEGMSVENIWTSDYVLHRASEKEVLKVGAYVLQGRSIVLKNCCFDRAFIIQDITELIKWQTEYKKQCVATREIRHRIKNNLQLIAGILEKKAQTVAGNEVKSAYEDAYIRILSILVTQDDLTPEENGNVMLKSLMLQLCQDISFTYSFVNYSVIGDDISVSGSHGAVLCLIVSELIYNAMKYAWEDRQNGRIEVRIKEGILNHTLTVSDNGRGISGDLSKVGSTGLELVRILARERLRGDVRILTGNTGTRVEVDFID